MNTHQAPLKPVIDLLEHVRENHVLQISGQPSFSVQSALNILSGLDTEHDLISRSTTRTEKIKQMLGWAPDPQYSVLRGIDEASLRWAYNEGYFDRALHVHAAPPLPGVVDPVRVAPADRTLVVHSAPTGELGVLPGSDMGSERLLLLYTQASHEQLTRTPVLLTQSGLSFDTENHINAWGLSNPTRGMDVGSFVLRKSFAEAYAALILLVGSNGSDQAQTAVRALIERNTALHKVWDGEREIWQHHMGTQALHSVLEQWDQVATLSVQDARMWVQRISGTEFGAWLNDQPLAEIVIGEMIPSFDKRVMDLALREQVTQHIDDSSPLQELKEAHTYLQSKWNESGRAEGVFQRLHRSMQRTGLAMEWMIERDPILQALAQRFEAKRGPVCSQIVAELKGVALPNSTLSSRLEHYRKGTTPEPYVLPPVP